MNPLHNALGLLIDVAFDAVLLLFLLRLFAELWRVHFHNPISQVVYRWSNPVLAPLRRIVPNWKRINLSALLVAWLVSLLEWLIKLPLLYTDGHMPHLGGWLLVASASLLNLALFLYIALIFVWALASMLVPPAQGASHPVLGFITQLVEPAMRPLSRRMPHMGGLDFSPAIAILVLMLIRILVGQPLITIGLRMAAGVPWH